MMLLAFVGPNKQHCQYEDISQDTETLEYCQKLIHITKILVHGMGMHTDNFNQIDMSLSSSSFLTSFKAPYCTPKTPLTTASKSRNHPKNPHCSSKFQSRTLPPNRVQEEAESFHVIPALGYLAGAGWRGISTFRPP